MGVALVAGIGAFFGVLYLAYATGRQQAYADLSPYLEPPFEGEFPPTIIGYLHRQRRGG